LIYGEAGFAGGFVKWLFAGERFPAAPACLLSELGREFGIARAAAERLKAWNSRKPEVLFP
jgi:hypothetical protein